MMTNDDKRLDSAIDSIRGDHADPEAVLAAAQRVQTTLSRTSRPLNSTEDYINAIPDYVDGRLAPAQVLLFDEEKRQSVKLRKALAEYGEYGATEVAQPQKSDRKWTPYAVAASVVVAVAMFLFVARDLPMPDQGQLVQVVATEGRLYSVADGQLNLIVPGTWLSGREQVRTGPGSTARLRLDDGSEVELNERSQLSMLRRFGGNRIDVTRGQIIVAASPQGSGTLDVTTSDFIVSVTGTIFEVGHGSTGSRVSVIEGEVLVHSAVTSESLSPGQQIDARGRRHIDIQQAIGWSADADSYIEMLQDVSALQRELAAALATEKRYSTRLLAMAPADTALYLAVPNAPEKMVEMYDIMAQRMQQGDRLSAVWAEVEASTDGHLDTMMSWLRQMGSTLGDETVFLVTLAAGTGEDGVIGTPIILSEVNAATFTSSFYAGLAELRQQAGRPGERFDIRIIDSPADAEDDELSIWLYGDLLVASTQVAGLQQIEAILNGQAESVSGGVFHNLLESAYSEGAEFLGGLNVAQILVSMDVGERERVATGIDNVRYLIAHRSQADGLASLDATLHFEGARRGIAGWLSAPSPMGSLEFFSVDATLAAAITTKDLTSILMEARGMADALIQDATGSGSNEMAPELQLVVEELATSLGSQAAIGIDGPTLPVPAWKIVVEVYDSITLQYRIESLIAELNQRVIDEGRDAVLSITQAPVGSYAGWTVSATSSGSVATPFSDLLSIHYAYVDGYLVVAPNATVVEMAISTYQSGVSVMDNTAFRALLPQDGSLDFSAVAFNRVGELIAEMAGYLPNDLSAEQRTAIDAVDVESESGPTLHVVYGEADRIRVFQKGSAQLPFNVAELMSLSTLLNEDAFRTMLEASGD